MIPQPEKISEYTVSPLQIIPEYNGFKCCLKLSPTRLTNSSRPSFNTTTRAQRVQARALRRAVRSAQQEVRKTSPHNQGSAAEISIQNPSNPLGVILRIASASIGRIS